MLSLDPITIIGEEQHSNVIAIASITAILPK